MCTSAAYILVDSFGCILPLAVAGDNQKSCLPLDFGTPLVGGGENKWLAAGS